MEDKPGQILRFPRGLPPEEPPPDGPSYQLTFKPEATAELDRLVGRTGAPSREALVQRAIHLLCTAFPKGSPNLEIHLVAPDEAHEVLFTEWG